jgi:ankyrin repeat protein
MQGRAFMTSIWRASNEGNLAEVERLVGQDPGLLNAGGRHGHTPLILASERGHVGVVRWLLDKEAAIDERDCFDWTALWLACSYGRAPVVRLLMERGADPTIANGLGATPLMAASNGGHLEVVRLLLGHPSAETIINCRDHYGKTALSEACDYGRGGVVRALLGSGADPTIAHNNGRTPMAMAKQLDLLPYGATVEGRRECVAALEVSFFALGLLMSTWDPLFVSVGGGAGLPAVEGPAGGRPARERRGGGGGGRRRGGGGGGEGGARGLRGA